MAFLLVECTYEEIFLSVVNTPRPDNVRGQDVRIWTLQSLYWIYQGNGQHFQTSILLNLGIF